MKWQICSRAEFERLKATDPEQLTELERVVRFIYLQRTVFGGKVDCHSFGVSRDNPARFDLTKLVPMLEDVYERLCGVLIECQPYADFIRTYDHAEMLFYLDPPYYGGENDYGKNIFSRADYELLRGLLEGLKGRFILSINDHPAIRETFKGFKFEEVSLNYSVRKGKGTPAKELIITNRRKML